MGLQSWKGPLGGREDDGGEASVGVPTPTLCPRSYAPLLPGRGLRPCFNRRLTFGLRPTLYHESGQCSSARHREGAQHMFAEMTMAGDERA